MIAYSLTIPGVPTAKARPRMTKSGHVYTPQKTVGYERMVQTLFVEKCGQPRLEGGAS